MEFDPQLHHRHSIRLKGYNYSLAGAYFVTLVAWRRECLFGEIALPGEETQLSPSGKIAEDVWLGLPDHYPNIELGAFCVMPNHVHGVILLNDPGIPATYVGAGLIPAPTAPVNGINPNLTAPKRYPLSEIIRAFKTFSARQINELRKTPGVPVWQRNYYEHIIRNEEEHRQIQLYIETNPLHWLEDSENVLNSM